MKSMKLGFVAALPFVLLFATSLSADRRRASEALVAGFKKHLAAH